MCVSMSCLELEHHSNLPAVVAIAELYPRPIGKCKGSANCHDCISWNRPWRAEEKKIKRQEYCRRKMESNIGDDVNVKVIRHEELGVDESDAPVEDRDDYFQRCSENSDVVLYLKERTAQCEISQCPDNKGKQRCRKTNDCEELEVPSVGFGNGSVPLYEELKIVIEGCYTEEVKG